MKRLSLLLFFCSLWIIELAAQDWSWLNPYPQNNQLRSIQFIGEEKGWAVGNAIDRKVEELPCSPPRVLSMIQSGS